MNSPKKEQNSEPQNDDPKTTKYYNVTNDKIMNEIQELLTDQEMIKKKFIEQNNDYYILEIIFPKQITLTKDDIKFLLYINKEYPKIEPELYCLTVFSNPHLCDGRNLINNIINGEWSNNQLPIEIIINKIPKFIIKYNEHKDNNKLVGKLILNKYYQINFLRNLPIFFHIISNENKIITISDISLCLYDLDKNVGFCKLSFFVDIKDLIEIKINSNENKINLKYKNSLNNKTKKININTSFYETINTILKEKMQIYQKKTGKLPDIDINNVEKEIEEREKELKNKENNYNLEKHLYLMSLYQKAVEYYSAVNNPKFIEITHKIHNLLQNIKLSSDSNEKKDEIKKDILNRDKTNNNINKKEDKKENSTNLINNLKDKIEKTNDKKEENKKEENKKDENKKEEIQKDEVKKNEDQKKEIEKPDNKKENDKKDKKLEKSEKVEKKNEEKKENKEIENDNIKDKKKEEKDNKIINKENKTETTNNLINENKDNKNKEEALRLKIDEGQLGTLDVGDDEEEEEEDDEK